MRTRTLVATGAAVALLAVPSAAPASGPPAEPGAGHGSAQGQAKRSEAPGAERRRAPRTPAETGAQAGVAEAATPTGAQESTTPTGSEAAPVSEAAPGPDAPKARKARAYGKYCKNESKKQVEGEKGTAFSRCVTAMARLGSGKTSNPARACRGLGKKHVKGEKGTAYSRCVRAAAKLRGDKRRSDPSRYTDPFDQD